jgi:glycosyltransferase involved in cell wall biosynthesis
MKNIKTIIVLYPSFDRGGATKNLINFINECASKNIKIYLVSNIDKKQKKRIFNKDIKIVNFFGHSQNIFLRRFFTSFFSIFSLIKLFNRINHKESIVISFQSHILPIIFCRLFQRKIVIRNSEDVIDATKYADKKFSAYLIFVLKVLIYNFSNGIITNSSKSKSSLDSIIFKKRSILIYNPYLRKIVKSKKRIVKNYILSVGRFCKQKNQIISIKAFALFLKEFPNYKLIMIGHGQDELKLKKICRNLNISKNVIFKRWINDPKKFYIKSKILIFPSLYEGLPNTLIDAVNHNLPCISSQCSGAIDILTKKKGIFLTNKKDFNQLSKKMIYVIRNYRKVTKDTVVIKRKLDRFLIKSQVQKYLDYIKSIMK